MGAIFAVIAILVVAEENQVKELPGWSGELP